jgi:hypothetical protein
MQKEGEIIGSLKFERENAIWFVLCYTQVWMSLFLQEFYVLSLVVVEKTSENHRHVTSHWQTLSHNVVHSPWTGFELTNLVVIGTYYTGYYLLQRISTNMLGYASFQLFGFDFLLDDQLQVHLIEINGAPACAEWVYWYLCCHINVCNYFLKPNHTNLPLKKKPSGNWYNPECLFIHLHLHIKGSLGSQKKCPLYKG